MLNREFPRIPEGHFVSLPNASADGSESETIWHTSDCSQAAALSIPLSASESVPPAPVGIAIFTCVSLAFKRQEVKRIFSGRVGKFNAKSPRHSASSRNRRN